MAAVPLFRYTNMAVVTSTENTLYGRTVWHSVDQEVTSDLHLS